MTMYGKQERNGKEGVVWDALKTCIKAFQLLLLPVQVVCQINSNEQSCRGWVDGHIICCIVQELCPSISLNVMRIIVTPS
jgi:hypothetical protein